MGMILGCHDDNDNEFELDESGEPIPFDDSGSMFSTPKEEGIDYIYDEATGNKYVKKQD